MGKGPARWKREVQDYHVLAFVREAGDDVVLVVANHEPRTGPDQPVHIDLPMWSTVIMRM